MRKRDRVLASVTATLAFVSVLDQLSRRPEDRDWHGHVAGVPYDYRMPTIERLLDRLWNPNDERILVPQVFGLGWTINAYQVKRHIQQLVAKSSVGQQSAQGATTMPLDRQSSFADRPPG